MINGTSASETLQGTAGKDEINFSQGGNDIVKGLGDNDILFGGSKFDATDRIDGGEGYDLLDLTGDYSAGLTMELDTLRNVEEIRFNSGHSYAIKTHDGMVKAGQVFKIDGYFMSSGDTLVVDGSAETTGSFLMYDGSQSNDTFKGGINDDTFSLSGGNDTVYGGGGDDVISFGDSLNQDDFVDGGKGNDVLYLRGNYSNQLGLDNTLIKNIETIGVSEDFTYSLVTEDSLVASGKNLYITAEGITGSGKLIFNGSAETNGTFAIRDSIGHDFIIGGQQGDRFEAYRGGSDFLSGQGGDDTFYMKASLENSDIVSGGAGKDWLSLEGDYSAGLTMNASTFNGIEDLSFGGGFDYKIKLHDGNVADGATLKIIGGYLEAGDKLEVDGSAETDGHFEFYGGEGNDIFKGGAQDDYFTGYQGGTDKFYGGAGDDFADFGSKLSSNDFFNGGAGDDGVYLSGNYGSLTLGSSRLASVESIDLGGDHSYDITTQDSLVAAGKTLAVSAYWIETGQNFQFDGSAETNGSFELTGSQGSDILIGGAKGDSFSFLNRGGNDVAKGNGGDDIFYVDNNFTAADRIDGGSGDNDTLSIVKASPQQLVLANDTIKNIERIEFYSGYDYNLKLANGNLAAGTELTVDAHNLSSTNTLVFDASAETAGHFWITAGAGDDTITTGAGNDVINGRSGADTMSGGNGDDIYFVDSAGDKVIEANGQGVDTVNSSVSFSLAGQYIENLGFNGAGNFNGTGNKLDNTILGNDGDNRLDGAAGADTLKGGDGNDTYIVDNVGDVAVEIYGGGFDNVEASVSYSLKGQYVENLKLVGDANIDGTGNKQFNTIIGNAGNNIINGMDGSDFLTGGSGGDRFVFSTALGAMNVDTITDFNAAADSIRLDNAIFLGLADGALDGSAFKDIGTGMIDASDCILYDSDTGELFFDRDGSGSTYDAVLFATLSNHETISYNDFLVI
ncbi:calcium-binding protein [Corticibacterium sp. UT-5YL-CI-8]|nr:calcium-binding protein [Tianweitania sp. UT-5YL-CI-8]